MGVFVWANIGCCHNVCVSSLIVAGLLGCIHHFASNTQIYNPLLLLVITYKARLLGSRHLNFVFILSKDMWLSCFCIVIWFLFLFSNWVLPCLGTTWLPWCWLMLYNLLCWFLNCFSFYLLWLISYYNLNLILALSLLSWCYNLCLGFWCTFLGLHMGYNVFKFLVIHVRVVNGCLFDFLVLIQLYSNFRLSTRRLLSSIYTTFNCIIISRNFCNKSLATDHLSGFSNLHNGRLAGLDSHRLILLLNL